MRKLTTLALVLALLAVGFIAGSWATWRHAAPGQSQSGRKILYWVDPMHPAYKSDKPGIAPDCGMQLEPVYADEPGAPVVAGAVKVSDEKRQLIGVRTGVVEEQPIERAIRTVGRVAVDDNRLYRLQGASDGIVTQLQDNSAGSLVRKNELLLTFFTRDYLTAQQAYLFGLDTLDRFMASGAPEDQLNLTKAQVRSAIDGLRTLGMGDIQIAALAKTRKATTEIELRSPVTGYVMVRSATPRQRFERGTELYEIADLARMWILADVFENEAPYLAPGTRVRVSQPYARAKTFEARVAAALPRFDPDSRTFKVRLEADNADYSLRPGMFVDVDLPVSLPRAVTVPSDAVIDSGVRKVVFVDRGGAGFEPREVETGWRFDDRVEIVRGLKPGERIALSGTFLLDSDSRMKAAAAGVVSPVRDPVCGMQIDREKAGAAHRTATHANETYYFCSEECQKRFLADPAKYASSDKGQARPPMATHAGPLRDLRPIEAPGLESVPGADATPPPPALARRFQQLAAVQRPPDLQPVDSPAPPSSPPGDGTAASTTVVVDVACGTLVLRAEAEKAGLISRHQGTPYYFVSRACKDLFDKNPTRYLSAAQQAPASPGRAPSAGTRPAATTAAAQAKPRAIDPVCGMEVEVQAATSAGLKSDYRGTTYYFCSDECKKTFDAEPAKYAVKK